MLVLTRKPGQSLMIGDGVEVQVLSVAGEKVRLGITAPRDVSIFRNEVYDRIEAEQGGGGGSDEGEASVSNIETTTVTTVIVRQTSRTLNLTLPFDSFREMRRARERLTARLRNWSRRRRSSAISCSNASSI